MASVAEQDIAWRSHWLQQALTADPAVAPPLQERQEADVCIVGGGYLGLWTAIRLRERRPELDVVILERDICGGGASGRNSGMVLSAWTKFSALAGLRGEEEALRLVRLSADAIEGIEAFCKANAIDCWFDRVGWIWGATCAAQRGAWDEPLGRLARHGYHPARPVTRDEIAGLTGTTSHEAGVLDPSAATIHPGLLVRGLRRVAVQLGIKIYEKSAMTRFSRRGKPVVTTAGGSVRADKLILAMNARSAAVPELSPALFVISSDDAISTPMPEVLERVGYLRGPLMIDSRVFVSGYRVTPDHRLLVGVTGGHIGFDGLLDARFDRPSPRLADMRRALRDGHPALADFTAASAWCGPIDRTDSGLPLFGAFPANPNIFYGYGFSGNGIGMSYIGGQILASLALGEKDGWSGSALVRPVERGFPPEPFRFVGAHLVRGAVRRRDRLQHEGRTPGAITNWLAGLAPSGVTPSKPNQRE